MWRAFCVLAGLAGPVPLASLGKFGFLRGALGMVQIYPVLICDSADAGMWPMARAACPDIFAPIFQGRSAFQNAAQALRGPQMARPLVVVAMAHRFLALGQLAALGIAPADILALPSLPDRTMALGLAALHLQARAGAEVGLLALPLAGALPQLDGVAQAVPRAVPDILQGKIGQFCTGKQDDTGLWFGTAGRIVQLLQRHAGTEMGAWGAALAAARRDLAFTCLDECTAVVDAAPLAQALGDLPNWPVPGAQGGVHASWQGLRRHLGEDAQAVAMSGPVTALGCRDCLLVAGDPGQPLVALGLENILAVALPDGVLVAPLGPDGAGGASAGPTGRLPLAVPLPVQAQPPRRTDRPWGWFETLAQGPRFAVRRVVLHPGAQMGLHSHQFCAEHWVVVAGTAQLRLDYTTQLLPEGQAAYAPAGTVHQLANPGKLPLTLIELRTGAHLEQDDILRYDIAPPHLPGP